MINLISQFVVKNDVGELAKSKKTDPLDHNRMSKDLSVLKEKEKENKDKLKTSGSKGNNDGGEDNSSNKKGKLLTALVEDAELQDHVWSCDTHILREELLSCLSAYIIKETEKKHNAKEDITFWVDQGKLGI